MNDAPKRAGGTLASRRTLRVASIVDCSGRQASLEALDGQLNDDRFAAKMDEKTIKVDAVRLVLEACPPDRTAELNKLD